VAGTKLGGSQKEVVYCIVTVEQRNSTINKRNCPNDIWQILRLAGERLSSIPAQIVPLTRIWDPGPPPSFIRGQFYLTHPSYMAGSGVLVASRTVIAG